MNAKLIEALQGIDHAMNQPGDALDFHGDQDPITLTITAEQARHIRALIEEGTAP